MDKSVVFYSWQSDLPNATNRGFIEKALENAAKSIRDDDSIEVQPVIDRDTDGVPGSPDIARTIFKKIDKSQVFVCDVSIINQGSRKHRRAPNPNVLIELGYALRSLGEERILMVLNAAFGKPETLPFDLNKKRVVCYCMHPDSADRTTERTAFTARLEKALRTIFDQMETDPLRESPSNLLKEYLVNDLYRIKLDEMMRRETSKVLECISRITLQFQSDPLLDHKELVNKLEKGTATLCSLIAVGCHYGDQKHDPIWRRSLEQILNPQGVALPNGLEHYPALILLYAAGIAAVATEKYHTLKSLLIDTTYPTQIEKVPLVLEFSAWDFMNAKTAMDLFDQPSKMTPLSNYLLEHLKGPLGEVIPSAEYEQMFDTFEYFFALSRADLAEKTGQQHSVAIGRFVWKQRVRVRQGRLYRTGIIESMGNEANKNGRAWGPLSAGFFSGDISRFNQIKDEFDKRLDELYYHYA